MRDLDDRVREAVRQFWETRSAQGKNQGGTSGVRDHGNRTAVTGGAQLDGFAYLVRDLLIEEGISESDIHCKKTLELPGYYRAEKQWDLLVIVNGQLLAAMEFKSQIGPSFGNNFNNRTEEALGNSADLMTAYRDGAFKGSAKPWVGFLMLLEDCAKTHKAVKVKEPHFEVFEEFKGASYAVRYELLLTKLVRERYYDATCFLLSDREDGLKSGAFSVPSPELSFKNLATSVLARAIAHLKSRDGGG